MSKIRVLLADDHKIVLEGLRSLLEPEFGIVGTAEDGRALLKAAEKLHPDVIVADISMPPAVHFRHRYAVFRVSRRDELLSVRRIQGRRTPGYAQGDQCPLS